MTITLPPSLQGEDKGKGNTDGFYKRERLFYCEKDCGILVPFSRVRRRVSSSSSPSDLKSSSRVETEELTMGDRITYFINDNCRHGMVISMQEKDGQHFVRISTVSHIHIKLNTF